MRMLTSFNDETLARRFSLFLQKQGIENNIEMDMESKMKQFSYLVWVVDEDKLALAQNFLEEFNKNPKGSEFNVSLKSEETLTGAGGSNAVVAKRKDYPAKITMFILLVCLAIFLLNWYEEMEIKKENPKISYVLLTPVQEALLFDVPDVLVKLDQAIKKYHLNPNEEISKQSAAAAEEIKKVENLPYFRGFYDVIVSKIGKGKAKLSGPYFEKIGRGEVWRLFSPCILHIEFLHLAFNMIWLWILGKQIEQRLNGTKYILLMLIVGVISNISQYLMSGPYFLGYSGVLMGMAGFIWARQKVAPWEGYPLQKFVLLFLAAYVLLMFVLSFFSFVTQAFGFNLFAPNIANTAHIVGAVAGYILGRLPVFSWRVRHER